MKDEWGLLRSVYFTTIDIHLNPNRGVTYVQRPVELGNDAIRSSPTDVGQHQEVDTILLGFRGHTQASCTWRENSL